MKYDFEQAKQKVAERHLFKDWNSLFSYYGAQANTFEWITRHMHEYQEIEEEVFKAVCNEAVKMDRETVKRKCVYYERENIVFDLQTFDSLPLPFPES